MLDAPGDLRFDTDRGHFRTQPVADTFNIRTPLLALGLDQIARPGVNFWLQDLEGQILQFTLDARHPQASGQRRVDLARLLRHCEHFLAISLVGWLAHLTDGVEARS